MTQVGRKKRRRNFKKVENIGQNEDDIERPVQGRRTHEDRRDEKDVAPPEGTNEATMRRGKKKN